MNIPRQRRFNEREYSTSKHSEVLNYLNSLLNVPIEFRVMEAPVFCTSELRDVIATAAIELVEECTNGSYKHHSQGALNPAYTVPNQNDRPLFSVVDFAVTEVNGTYVPKLVEMQGFPSLFGYQALLADALHSVYGFDDSYHSTFAGLGRDEYLSLLDTAIRSGHHVDNVALVEYDPFNQKTLPDFIATQRLLGVQPTDIRSIVKQGNHLYHERGGALVPLRRIYNRAIVDELEENYVKIPFAWNEDIDVEWAGHPNWYFRISKYALPYLHHHSVPITRFICDLDTVPQNLSDYVLKPLYAFAGKGVNVSPTHADIEAIPDEQRSGWVLMEKIHYAECLATPLGMNKLEIRCMLIWLPNSQRPVPTVSLVRSGRGAMMGARFNNIDWTGATCCLFTDND